MKELQLFVQRLMSLDFCYLDPERGLLGESWWLDIMLQGELNAEGMILDFGLVKQQVKQWVNEQFDHRLLLPAHYDSLRCPDENRIEFVLSSGEHIIHQGPEEAVQWIASAAITPDSVADQIEADLYRLLPPHIYEVEVQLYPEAHQPYFHYAHGLKQHSGNCQRIAHGHRSRIKIWQNEQRSPELEQFWLHELGDRYLAYEQDLSTIKQHQDQAYFCFQYQASQGNFLLELPASQCYLLPTETTVENIAAHIAQNLKQRYPKDHFRVQIYEGIDKGAISSL